MAQLYVDYMSQPSRAVAIFCRINRLDVQEKIVNIAKGGTRSPEFRAINPLGKVPFLREADGFGVPESVAMLRYLCSTRGDVCGHWYPSDPRERALVDAMLAWHGSTLRVGSMLVVWHRAISLSMGFQGNERLVQDYGIPTLKAALQVLEDYWLRGRPYVAGGEISIADLLVACEVEQLVLLDAAVEGPRFGELIDQHPAIQAWLTRVRNRCSPHYADVHAMLRVVRQRLLDRAPNKL